MINSSELGIESEIAREDFYLRELVKISADGTVPEPVAPELEDAESADIAGVRGVSGFRLAGAGEELPVDPGITSALKHAAGKATQLC